MFWKTKENAWIMCQVLKTRAWTNDVYMAKANYRSDWELSIAPVATISSIDATYFNSKDQSVSLIEVFLVCQWRLFKKVKCPVRAFEWVVIGCRWIWQLLCGEWHFSCVQLKQHAMRQSCEDTLMILMRYYHISFNLLSQLNERRVHLRWGESMSPSGVHLCHFTVLNPNHQSGVEALMAYCRTRYSVKGNGPLANCWPARDSMSLPPAHWPVMAGSERATVHLHWGWFVCNSKIANWQVSARSLFIVVAYSSSVSRLVLSMFSQKKATNNREAPGAEPWKCRCLPVTMQSLLNWTTCSWRPNPAMSMTRWQASRLGIPEAQTVDSHAACFLRSSCHLFIRQCHACLPAPKTIQLRKFTPRVENYKVNSSISKFTSNCWQHHASDAVVHIRGGRSSFSLTYRSLIHLLTHSLTYSSRFRSHIQVRHSTHSGLFHWFFCHRHPPCRQLPFITGAAYETSFVLSSACLASHMFGLFALAETTSLCQEATELARNCMPITRHLYCTHSFPTSLPNILQFIGLLFRVSFFQFTSVCLS